jgi:hypothetical protein
MTTLNKQCLAWATLIYERMLFIICIVLHHDCIGLQHDCIGLHHDCIGLHQDCIGLHYDCIGLQHNCIGLQRQYDRGRGDPAPTVCEKCG